MHGQLTISGAKTRFLRSPRPRACALVIIALTLPGVTMASGSGLTTSAGPAPQAARAATLTTVIVDGSSVYSPPQLFATYRDQLGRPYSRESTRTIALARGSLCARCYVSRKSRSTTR